MLRDKDLNEAHRELRQLPYATENPAAVPAIVTSLQTCTLLLLRAVDRLAYRSELYVTDTRRDLQSVHAALNDLSRKLQL